MTAARAVRQIAARGTRAIGAASPRLVLFASWLVLIVYAYPGLMTLDSLDHLAEARSGVYTDSHPPAISVVWKLADFIVAGPFGMLVIQSGMFLLGLYAVLRRTLAPKPAAWAAGLLFVFPPVMMPLAVIWKDSVMAGFLLLGLAAMASPRRWIRVAGLVALGAATAIRYNAFGATFPIVVLMFEWRIGLHWFKRYALALAAWLGVTFGAFAFNAAITDHAMHPWPSTLALYDIVGTLAHVDEDLSDDELRALFDGTQLRITERIHPHIRSIYSTRNYLPIIVHPTDAMWSTPFRGQYPAPPAQRAAISRAFVDVVTRYPAAYAAHRLHVMAEVLAFTSHDPAGTVIDRDVLDKSEPLSRMAGELEVATTWSKLQRGMTLLIRWVDQRIPIFVPWIYFVISLALLPLARRYRPVLSMIASGLAFEATLLFLAASPDYRYSHWMIVCTLIAVVELTARRAAGHGERAA